MSNSEIEYFYACHSAFAYLGSSKFMAIARELGRKIVHKPIDLRLIVATNGPGAFADRSKAHYKYYFGREIERWSRIRNAPIMDHGPTHHQNDITLGNGMLIAGLRQGLNIDHLAHGMLQAHWHQDADLAAADDLRKIAASLEIDPEPLLAEALSPETQAIYQANTQEALERNVFGSPTYVLDGDMFYGQDRLEVMQEAADTPFKYVLSR